MVVPNVKPVRPMVASRPFSTELVLDRLSEAWAEHASTSYFTFGVHVSGAFLTPPTLGSALYLLVLRLMARDYAGASALFSSISTDSELTAEEQQIFDLLGDLHAGSRARRASNQEPAPPRLTGDLIGPTRCSADVKRPPLPPPRRPSPPPAQRTSMPCARR